MLDDGFNLHRRLLISYENTPLGFRATIPRSGIGKLAKEACNFSKHSRYISSRSDHVIKVIAIR